MNPHLNSNHTRIHVFCLKSQVLQFSQLVFTGDRHAENIMFDCSTGGIVHVDFDCLFNKGDSFDWPEMVPFRLTHNLVDVFGVTGWLDSPLGPVFLKVNLYL